MSLRARLMVVLIALVAGGLIITGIVTYTSLRSFLTNRVDEQLITAQGPMARMLTQTIEPFRRGSSIPAVPVGTFGYLRTTSGETLAAVVFSTDPEPAAPDLPEGSAYATPFTTGAIEDSSLRYRVIVSPLDPGRVVIIAFPLTEVARTLGRLFAILVAVTISVVVGLAALARWLIIRELRPLHQIEETAGAIAAGDLSRRIERADEETEVGRLGVSLNAMLAQIEDAFAEKDASEDRLRRFLADASHELRTPLTSIRGYAELFRRGADARPEDLAKAMRRIEDEATRMGQLVDDLLLLARLDQGRPLEREPVDLARIARDAAASARAVDPDRPLDVVGPDDLAVEGDAARLRQVADNLLRNALVHTPDGTPIHVRAYTDDGSAILEVADEGPGIAVEDLARVFERFHRPDSTRAAGTEGVGLGLSIATAIARAHGGELRVSSEPGAGATFRLILPIDRAGEMAVPGHAGTALR